MTTEEAIAQGSDSNICLSRRLNLLALWKILEYQVIIIIIVTTLRDKMFLFLLKITKLSREAEHSNFKLFPLVSVVNPVHVKLSFFPIKQSQSKVLTTDANKISN